MKNIWVNGEIYKNNLNNKVKKSAALVHGGVGNNMTTYTSLAKWSL